MIQALIEQLADRDAQRRVDARQALLAERDTAAVVGELLATLRAEDPTVDRGVIAGALRLFGEAVVQPLIDLIASDPPKEVARQASYAFTGLKTDLSVFVLALRHPHAEVRANAAYVFQCRRDDALPYAEHLVPLLDDPVETVRDRAGWALAEIGPGAVPLLRRTRRTPGADRARLRRAALVALAQTAGPSGLDQADVTLLQRLIRIKMLDEVPEEMHLCGGWFALPTTDQEAVLDAFDLSDAEPVTMRLGGAAWNHDHHDWSGPGKEHRKCSRVYVSPVMQGWTLVFGQRSEDTHLRTAASDEEREAALRRRCAELSRRFGAAHWYGMSCGDGWTSWCIAERGEVVRFYDVFTCEVEDGPQHPAEEGYLLPHQDGFPDDAFDGINPSHSTAFHARYEQVKEKFGIPDACYAVDIAARLSVDPSSIGPATRRTGHGVLALTACGRVHGHPRGALPI